MACKWTAASGTLSSPPSQGTLLRLPASSTLTRLLATDSWYKLPLLLLLLLTFITVQRSHGLNNGLARTPPMGWMSWARFACQIDCETYPSECISEELFKETAQILATEGYKEAGYTYVNIDDCWSNLVRDERTHKLMPNSTRFPSGIRKLSDYIHSLGLQFGIYSDIGTKTCGGYPGHLRDNGSLEYFTLDSDTFASWGVDSLKVDGCYVNNSNDYDWMYPKLGQALNATGRPILYACSWPAYQIDDNPDWQSIAQHCNLWRNYDDIMDEWSSILSIIKFYTDNLDTYVKFHGPGHWFDPDMLLIGNYGLSIDQCRSQMAIWSMFSAPLLMSNDLRDITDEQKDILLNRHVIQVDQDPAGQMARLAFNSSNLQVFVKRLSQPEGSFAVVYFNRAVLGSAKFISFTLHSILKHSYDWMGDAVITPQLAHGYSVHDLFQNGHMINKVSLKDYLSLKVNPSGVRMVKLIPLDE